MYEVSDVRRASIERTFTYHKPVGDQPQRYERIRAAAKALAFEIAACTPVSADQTAALRKLRECVMTANASIALEPLPAEVQLKPDTHAPAQRVAHGNDDLRVSFPRPMPRFKCHKVVQALHLEEVEHRPGGGAVLYPLDADYPPFIVPEAFVKRHKPTAGDYIVLYEDGYWSISPAPAFESGYTRIAD